MLQINLGKGVCVCGFFCFVFFCCFFFRGGGVEEGDARRWEDAQKEGSINYKFYLMLCHICLASIFEESVSVFFFCFFFFGGGG